MKLFNVLIAILLLAGSASANTWTAKEIVDWHLKYAVDTPGLYSDFFYRGSDDKHHYFSIRAVDHWVLMNVARREVKITDQRPLKKYSSENYLGYYAVDPQNKFNKIEGKK